MAGKKKYSKKQILEAIESAEGLRESSGNAELETAWHELWQKEAKILAPPIETPPLRFTGMRRPSSWLSPRLAVALAIALVAVGLFIFNPADNPGRDQPVDWAHLQSPRAFHGKTRLFHRKSRIEVLSGSFKLIPSNKGTVIETPTMAASFDFREPVDFTIRHSHLTIQVTGTDFFVQIERDKGFVHLKRGEVSIAFHPPGASKLTKVLRPGQVFRFVGETSSMHDDPSNREDVPQKKQAANLQIKDDSFEKETPDEEEEGRILYVIELTDGEQVIGSLISDDETQLLIITTDGEERLIDKADIVDRRKVRDTD